VAQREHPISTSASAALQILGSQIAAGRRNRRWTAKELAGRAAISPRTLRNVEQGIPSASIGIVFELAVLVGVPLYGATDAQLRDVRIRATDRLALLPERVREPGVVIDDDF